MLLSSPATSLISNQWVRFVYVKNSKIYINNTVTNIQQGSDRTYGQLRIGDARSHVGQHWNGKIAVVRIYNRNLTDQEISKNYEVFDKVVNNNQQLGTSTSTTSRDEEVAVGTLVANLTWILIPQALLSVLSVVMDLMISKISQVRSF